MRQWQFHKNKNKDQVQRLTCSSKLSGPSSCAVLGIPVLVFTGLHFVPPTLLLELGRPEPSQLSLSAHLPVSGKKYCLFV